MRSNALTHRLGIRHPVIGAPMAGASHGALARAVSEAGGLGMVGVGSRSDSAFVRREAAIASDGGRLPFGVGLQVWALPHQPGVVAAVAEVAPTLVSLSFGDIRPHRDLLRAAGTLIAVQVNTVADARVAVEAGADVVVAQGGEAGGHTGRVATLPLLQAVLDAVEVPVVAAGGIGTGRGLAAVLAAGAQAGWIGTALLTSHESAFAPAAKKRVLAAAESDTVLTRVFDLAAGYDWPERYAGRALRNTFTERWHGHEDDLVASQADAGAELARAMEAEAYDIGVVYAGEASGLVREEGPAGAVVATMVAEAEACLRMAARLLDD